MKNERAPPHTHTHTPAVSYIFFNLLLLLLFLPNIEKPNEAWNGDAQHDNLHVSLAVV